MTEIRVSDSVFEAPRWLWEDRIAEGMVTLVAGWPGGGKGLFCSYLAAEMSRHSNVLFSLPENKLRQSVRPRLMAADANLDRVFYEREWRLPRDAELVEAAIVRRKAKLLVLDPIAAHIDYTDRSRISRSNERIRLVSEPLEAIAERHDCAIVITEHLNEHVTANMHLLQAVAGGGSGLPAAAQQIYVIGKDPEDDARHLLCYVKGNIHEVEPFAFRRNIVLLTDTSGRSQTYAWLGPVGEVEFPDPVSMLLKPRRDKPGPSPAKEAAASEWLVKYLRAQDGFDQSEKIREAAALAGHTDKTLDRARKALRITQEDGNVFQQDGEDGVRKWWRRLPPELMDEEIEGEGDE